MRLLTIILFLLPVFVYSQVGGDNGYQALDFLNSSRTAALGGNAISINDADLSQFFQNPATLDSIPSKQIFFNINPYFADVIVFSGAYVFDMKKLKGFAVGLKFIDFNNLERRDATGNSLGEFDASDYVLSLAKSHRIGPFSLGAKLNWIHSSLDTFSSDALSMDVGGVFNVKKNWTVGMTISNLGGRLSNYNELNKIDIPLDVKIGTTFKPEYMPFRFTVTTSNLTDENELEIEETEGRSNEQVERILRRIDFGTELLLSENFQLLFGYSHKRKQELKLEDRSGGAGFSYGLMVKIKRITLRYSRATFHVSGGSSFISIQTNMNNFQRIL